MILKFNSADLDKVGSGIIGLSQETEATLDAITGIVDGLGSFWQGQSNEELLRNINTSIVEIKNLIRRYENTGTSVRTIARNLDDNTHENINQIHKVEY